MKKRVLILDDDKDLLCVLSEIFKYEGFDSSILETTEDLMTDVRSYRPDLVILDFGLNGTDGGTWCYRLKSNLEFSNIPVIIFSAYSNKDIEDGSFRCDHFIAKPFDLENLIKSINGLINQKEIAFNISNKN